MKLSLISESWDSRAEFMAAVAEAIPRDIHSRLIRLSRIGNVPKNDTQRFMNSDIAMFLSGRKRILLASYKEMEHVGKLVSDGYFEERGRSVGRAPFVRNGVPDSDSCFFFDEEYADVVEYLNDPKAGRAAIGSGVRDYAFGLAMGYNYKEVVSFGKRGFLSARIPDDIWEAAYEIAGAISDNDEQAARVNYEKFRELLARNPLAPQPLSAMYRHLDFWLTDVEKHMGSPLPGWLKSAQKEFRRSI